MNSNIPRSDERSSLLNSIRLWWASIFTFLMILNFNQIGAHLGFAPQPKYWAIGIFVISLLISLPHFKVINIFRYRITWWAVGYLFFSTFWLLNADNSQSAVDGLTMVITTCLYVFTGILTYPSISRNEWLWGATLWLGLLAAVASVFADFLMPELFFFTDLSSGSTDRAAGFYVNPNFAAQTILVVLSCLLLRSPPRTSLIAAIIALPALLITFSRGGLMGWLVLITFAAVRGNLPRYSLAALLGAALAIVISGPLLLDTISAWIAPENRNALNRLAWMLGQGDLTDYAASDRQWVASFAWSTFLESPLTGHGLGYTTAWIAGVGAHNMLLRHLVEYGIFGAIIFPSFFILSIFTSNDHNSKFDLILISFVFLLMSVFSHNMLEQGSFVLIWLACCLMQSSDPKFQRRLVRRAIP